MISEYLDRRKVPLIGESEWQELRRIYWASIITAATIGFVLGVVIGGLP